MGFGSATVDDNDKGDCHDNDIRALNTGATSMATWISIKMVITMCKDAANGNDDDSNNDTGIGGDNKP